MPENYRLPIRTAPKHQAVYGRNGCGIGQLEAADQLLCLLSGAIPSDSIGNHWNEEEKYGTRQSQ